MLSTAVQLLKFYVAVLILLTFGVSDEVQAQGGKPPEIQPGSVIGTVSDANGDAVARATVLMESADLESRRTVETNENGFYEFHDVEPGILFHITASAAGLAEWKSPPITTAPNQFKILDIRLRVPTVITTVEVNQTIDDVATEQVKIQEKQRIFGFIPNFYVVYGANTAPLTAKLKFRLALKTATDPITFLGTGFVSGLQQAGDTPNFGQGAQGFAKRFAVNTADAFTVIMIGGAVLPSLLHQDPRYFYQGTGTTKLRIRHAALYPFVCKGDNGRSQPNYSSLGGDLASSAISSLYYPKSDRGATKVFTNFAISTGARIVASLAQEFILPKLTRKRVDPKQSWSSSQHQ